MALIGTLTSGVSALRAFTKDLEVIGNNIANVNTTAFKSSTSSFSNEFSNTMQNSSKSTATTPGVAAMQIGTGVRLTAINVSYNQGALSSTGTTSDLGISGSGFFQVNSANDGTGDVYATRAGAFHWDDNGYLVNAQGLFVMGQTISGATTTYNTAIQIKDTANIPAGERSVSVAIGKDGSITESYSDGSSKKIGQVLLMDFKQPAQLESVGNGLYTKLDAGGPTTSDNAVAFSAANYASVTPNSAGIGSIEAGTLELSNVDLTKEFANMITAQRSFQANSRLVTVADNVLEEIVNLKR